MYLIRNLIKEANVSNYHEFIQKIGNYVYKPLTTLDHLIKYNKHVKNYYCKYILIKLNYWISLSDNERINILFSLDRLLRIILVIFLILDTFYFGRLEIFYKVILIGFLPFIWCYIQYSIKDVYHFYIKKLTDKYSFVFIFEKEFSNNISRIGKTDAVWHHDRVSVEQYIEIMYDTQIDISCGYANYEYIGEPYAKDIVFMQYEKTFNKKMSLWTREDYEVVDESFNDLTGKEVGKANKILSKLPLLK